MTFLNLALLTSLRHEASGYFIHRVTDVLKILRD